jgi:hypothetical protein
MAWTVLLDEDFEVWLEEQEEHVQDEILAHAGLLRERGPLIGRPWVDAVKGSRYPNMKELRIQYKGDPWRVLFAFDPKRRAILLVGGNKRGDRRWYEKNVPLADKRFQRYLKVENHNG